MAAPQALSCACGATQPTRMRNAGTGTGRARDGMGSRGIERLDAGRLVVSFRAPAFGGYLFSCFPAGRSPGVRPPRAPLQRCLRDPASVDLRAAYCSARHPGTTSLFDSFRDQSDTEGHAFLAVLQDVCLLPAWRTRCSRGSKARFWDLIESRGIFEPTDGCACVHIIARGLAASIDLSVVLVYACAGTRWEQTR
ncbi:hypothetical protein C8F04DRAFT_572732 [Mycena alexandri]|uniref:Uncharacterized protein n=1 Tax=Mycena alexandri TaxID=1745969 RepID=A0AAD6SV44_9AGAR|nr:hypothetical protein C8F04DRAFT_572732 [Mycena alexandri]